MSFEDNILWIATDLGLIRMDIQTRDKQFYNTLNSGIPQNDVTAVYVDSKGNKWIGTRTNGAARFDGTKWVNYNYSNALIPYGPVTAISEDAQGNIWIGVNYYTKLYNLCKFDGSNWTSYGTSNNHPSKYIRNNPIQKITFDKNGNVWTCGSYNIQKFDGTNWTVYSSYDIGLNGDAYEIAFDKNGSLWGASDNGIFSFDGVKWQYYNYTNNKFPFSRANGLAIDSKSRIWVSTDNCVIMKDGEYWNIFNSASSGLPANNMTNIAVDKNQNVWISTLYNGLVKYDGTRWNLYSTSDLNLLHSYISGIAKDSKGNIWFTTKKEDYYTSLNPVLYKYDGKTLSSFKLPDSSSFSSDAVNMIIDRKDNIWIGTETKHNPLTEKTIPGAVLKFDGIKWNSYILPEINGFPVSANCIAADSRDGFWAGTFNGLWEYKGQWTLKHLGNSGLQSNNIEMLLFDLQDNLWIYAGAISVFDGKNWTSFNTDLQSNYTNIQSGTIDNSNTKWIGGYNGLLRFKSGPDLFRFNTANSAIPGNVIGAITSDQSGNVWVSVNDTALVKYDGNLWTSHSLPFLKPYYRILSLVSDMNNNIWVGTTKGLAILGSSDILITVQPDSTDQPVAVRYEYHLDQNYPNPFNPSTAISYSLAISSEVQLKIYDLLGREVSTLINKEQPAGKYKIQFNAASLPSGVYICTLKAGSFSDSRKLLLLK